MSKILVLTGSPRANGNTFTLVNAFTKTAKGNGHTVKVYDTTKMNVIGCRACDACFQNGNACVFDEGFNEIAADIMAADVVVFAAPVYFYAFPAQLKAVIDKMYSLTTQKAEAIAGKKCALIAVCGDPELDLDIIYQPYIKICELCAWKSVGTVLINGLMNIGDVHKTDGIKKVVELAEKL